MCYLAPFTVRAALKVKGKTLGALPPSPLPGAKRPWTALWPLLAKYC